MPHFSLIIPVYNVAPYITECLQSIRTQNYDDWEAIIVDDGSTDGSGEICDKFVLEDNRFRIFHKSNEGVSSARNLGIDNSLGEWIWFIDGDDYIQPNALECLSKKIMTTDCDTIFFGIINNKNGIISIPEKERKDIIKKSKNEFLLDVVCYYNPTILFSRQYFVSHDLRFTPGLKLAEDLELQYKYLFFAQKPIQIAESLYVYRRRNGSAMTNNDSHLNNLNCTFNVCNSLLNFITTNKFPFEDWFTIRIRQLLKSGLQSSAKLPQKELKNVRSNLKKLVSRYAKIGYTHIADRTLKLAMFNYQLYILGLKIFYKINGIK